MNSRTRLGLLATALALALVLRPLVARYLSEPLGLLYAVAASYIESLPQIYLWAGLLGAFVLIGLRRIPVSQHQPPSARAPKLEHRGRLGDWVRMLADRTRGSYFDWRLASQLAELESWIDPQTQMEPQIRRYLEIGRTRRSIEANRSLSRLNFELERLVGYLEDADNHS